MNRDFLPEDGGMCFILDSIGPAIFWMKNTRIPLDAVFMDAYGTILNVITMKTEPVQGRNESVEQYEARLPRYCCNGPVAVVLELHAGGLVPGSLLHECSLSSLLRRKNRL